MQTVITADINFKVDVRKRLIFVLKYEWAIQGLYARGNSRDASDYYCENIRMNIPFMRSPLLLLQRHDSRCNFAITLQITFCYQSLVYRITKSDRFIF